MRPYQNAIMLQIYQPWLFMKFPKHKMEGYWKCYILYQYHTPYMMMVIKVQGSQMMIALG